MRRKPRPGSYSLLATEPGHGLTPPDRSSSMLSMYIRGGKWNEWLVGALGITVPLHGYVWSACKISSWQYLGLKVQGTLGIPWASIWVLELTE